LIFITDSHAYDKTKGDRHEVDTKLYVRRKYMYVPTYIFILCIDFMFVCIDLCI